MPTKKDGGRRKKRGPKTSVVNPNEASNSVGDIPLVEDERFASQHWDPRFGRLPPRVSGGAAVDDERFRFKGSGSKASRVDRFGRVKRTRTKPVDASSSESDEDEGDDGGYLGISSSDSESSDSGGEKDVGPPIQYGRATRRLAVQGLDWSATRAVDIFACFASFGASGLRRISVHPSKLGLERLAAEERLGPQFIHPEERRMLSKSRSMLKTENVDSKAVLPSSDDVQVKNDSDDGDDDDEVGGVGVRDSEQRKWRSQEAIRKYEEERLRYYYAIAEFSEAKDADKIYEQCDGVEYGESRCEFSLSFVPDDMVINTVARDECDNLPDGYTPPETAPNTLSNTTVASTWDADAPDRLVLKKKVMRRKEADEDNLRAYIHSSSESEADMEDIERKRKLLLGGGDDAKDDQHENNDGLVVTFDPDMLEKEQVDIVDDENEEDDGGMTASFDLNKLQEEVGDKDENEQGMVVSFDPDVQVDKVVDKDETHWEARMRRMAERKAEKKKKRKERIKGGEGASTQETVATFDDPFFTDDRSDAKRAARAAKKRKRSVIAGTERVEDEAEKKKRVAQLELLMSDDGPRGGGLRKKLADAASDDEEDGVPKKKNKTRGRRRADKERVEMRKKVSAFDATDDRFKGLFDSHQFALDPTHPKFKMDDTTELIRAERQKRSHRNEDEKLPTRRAEQKQLSKENDHKSDVLGLAEKIKAKAKGTRVL